MPSEARLGSNGGELHERIVFQSAVGKSDAVEREVAIGEAHFVVAAVDGFGGNIVESDVAITLFASFAGEESVSHDLITKYYAAGQPGERTLEILKAQDVNERLQS